MKITKQVDSVYSWIRKNNTDIFAQLKKLSEEQGTAIKKGDSGKSIAISLEKWRLLGYLRKKI
jgi:SPX domain protein involved in polyphosphate accumulation